MHNAPGLDLDPEAAVAMFLGTAVAFVALSVILVLLVRSVPTKLILLGIVTMAAGICFAASNAAVAMAALVVVVLGVILVLVGLLCVGISYVVDLIVATRKGERDT
jgi:hypothetical protein